MQVFIIGATGYIGSGVARALRAAGHRVRGLARSDAAAARLADAGVEPVRGDASDAALIERAAREADGVVYAVSTGDARDPEVATTAVEAIRRGLAGSGKPFIYTSGIWVNAETGGRPIDESTPAVPAPIVAWRPTVERLVLEGAGRGVRAIVLRPGIVYGRGAGIPAMVAAGARDDGVVRYIGSGANHWPVIHVDDLGELYVRALERAPAGSILLGVNDDRVTYAEIARAASEGAGAPGATAAWPLEAARAALGPLADALALDQIADNTRTRELVGWSPRQPGILDDLRAGSYATAGTEAAAGR